LCSTGDARVGRADNRMIRLNGARCMDARVRKGLDLEQLARASRGRLSVATIRRAEQGEAVYLDTGRRLADLLRIPLGDLVVTADRASVLVSTQLADRPPAIAVLPFNVIGASDECKYFGDGLVEDLTTRLGSWWFPVISRNSSFAGRDAAVAPVSLGKELDADYIVEGSIRRADGQLRVTARLSATETGQQLWSSSYDRPFADVLALQDELTAAIVGQVNRTILEKEAHVVLHRDPSDLTAWELSLRGSWHFNMRTKGSNREAREAFERALKLDTSLPLAWYSLAMTHQQAILNQWSQSLNASLCDMSEVCADFARWHPGDPWLHIASAYVSVYSGERDSAISRLRDAIALDPNAAIAYSLYGQTLAMANRPDEAIEQFELATRLSPKDSDLWSVQSGIALSHFVAERYDDMLRWAQLAARTKPDMPFPRGIIAVAQVCLGNQDEARQSLGKMIELEPASSVRGMETIVRSTNREIVERYVNALRRAGAPR
jgi:adenylate cyclase